MMQYDNYDTDKRLKQLEDQSIPDLTKMNEHWEQMRETLSPNVQPGKNGNFLNRPGFYALAAAFIGLIVLVVVMYNRIKVETEEPVAKAPVIEKKVEPIKPYTAPVLPDSTFTINNSYAFTPLNFSFTTTRVDTTQISIAPLSFTPSVTSSLTAVSADYSVQLEGFFKQVEKQAQQFVIDTKKDTILYGNEGSAFYIPANTFAKSQVTIVLKEFYSYKDIVSNKLTTMSNGQQLITGGMINIRAIADGQEVKMKPNKSIQWFIPDTSAEMSQMQLFYGAGNNLRGTTATNAAIVEPLVSSSSVSVPTKKMYLRQDSGTTTRNTIDSMFDVSMRAYMDSVPGSKINMDVSNGTAADNSNDGINWIPQRQFFTPNFFTTRVRVLDLRDIPMRTVNTKNGTRAIFRMSDNSVLGKEELEKRLMERYSKYYSEIRVVERARLSTSNRSNGGNVVADGVGDSIWIDVTEAKRYRLEGKDTMRYGQTANGSYVNDNPLRGAYIASAKELASRYSVDIRNLGWINCDKFYRYGLPQIPFKIDLQDRATNYYALLVFDKIRSVMTGGVNGTQVMFPNVPEGMTGKVVVVGIKDGKSVMAIKDVTLSRTTVTDFVFEEVSTDEYKEELALLDK